MAWMRNEPDTTPSSPATPSPRPGGVRPARRLPGRPAGPSAP